MIQLDRSATEIGKNFPAEVGLVGDPKCGLHELTELLGRGSAVPQAAERRRRWAALRGQEQDHLRQDVESAMAARPMASLALMGALARALPPDVAVVEEAITTHKNVFERLGLLRDPKGFFAHRGWALGWGMGLRPGREAGVARLPGAVLIGDAPCSTESRRCGRPRITISP